MSKMRSVRMIALAAVTATMVPACGESSSRVAITTTYDPPIAIIAGPPKYDTGSKYVWFEHDLYVENSGDRSIAMNYVASEQYLGSHQLLMVDGSCGLGSSAPGETLPSVDCAAIGHLSYPLAPHASAKVATVTGYVGVKGTQPITNGTYEWTKDVMWKFADAEEFHTAHVKLTYVRK